MCGIVGVMSNFITNSELEQFYDLSAVATHRGRWGGGVACIQNGKKGRTTVRVARTTAPLNALVASERFYEIIGKDRSFLLGHARWPTVGGNEIKNVHPHVVGNITGVHNGTMQEVGGVKVTKDMSDSKMVFECIAEHGVDHFIKTSKGAYALVWINEDDGTVNFLRNSQRTLYGAEYGWNGRCSTLYFASEKAQLELVLSRHLKSMVDVKITLIPEMIHFKYPIRALHDVKPIEKVNYKPPVVEFKPETHSYVKWLEERTAANKAKTTLALPRSPTPGAVVPLSTSERAARALALLKADDKSTKEKSHDLKSITADATHEISRASCCWCSGRTTIGDKIWPLETLTKQRGDFLCDDCIGVPDVLEFLDPDVSSNGIVSIN